MEKLKRNQGRGRSPRQHKVMNHIDKERSEKEFKKLLAELSNKSGKNN